MLLLTQRDVAEKFSQKELKKMSEAEKTRIIEPIAERYEQEFKKNGLSNLKILCKAVNDSFVNTES